MDPEELKRLTSAVFDRAALEYDTVIDYFAPYGRRLVDLVAVGPGEVVLDTGAGRGAATFPAARAGAQVLATDLAPRMVELLAADAALLGLSHRVQPRVMDAERPELADATVDIVLSAFVIFFLPDPPAALREYHRVLRPGGRVGLTLFSGTTPALDFVARTLAGFMPGDPPRRPEGPADNPEKLAGLLREAGFSDIERVDETTEVVFASLDEWWRWMWSHGQRVFLEKVPADAMDAARAAVFEAATPLLRPDGAFVIGQGVSYTVARRP